MDKSEAVAGGESDLKLLQWAIPVLIEQAETLKFEKENRVDLWLVLLYASILELANGACRLISIGEPTGSRTMVRMALEACVDLKNLNSDDEYVNFLDVGSLSEWQKTYKLAQEGNPYFKVLCDEPGFEEEVAQEAERLAELKANGYRILNVRDRFKRAEMDDQYQGIYHWLCSDTHNSLRGLSMRHISLVDHENYKIHILKDASAESERPTVVFLLAYLIESSKMIHERFGGNQGAIEEVERRFNKLCEEG